MYSLDEEISLSKRVILSNGLKYRAIDKPDVQGGSVLKLNCALVYFDTISFDETFFEKCRFENVEFSGCIVSDVTFKNCFFSNVLFYDCYGFRSKFQSCKYVNVEILGGDFSRATFDENAKKSIRFGKNNLGSITDITGLRFL